MLGGLPRNAETMIAIPSIPTSTSAIRIATASVTQLVHEPSYYTIFEVAETPVGKSKLVPLSVIRAPGMVTDPTKGQGGILTKADEQDLEPLRFELLIQPVDGR